MSAYIVDRHHIAYLATYAASKTHIRYRMQNRPAAEDGPKLALAFATILQAENFRSIYHRYPDTDPEGPEAWKQEESMLPGDLDACEPFTVSEMEAYGWNQFKAVDLLKAVRCYDYQSCETEDWYSTDACRITGAITEIAAEMLAKGEAYEAAEWGAPRPDRGGSPAPLELLPDPEPEPELPEWHVAEADEQDSTKRARMMLKKAGYNQRQVSVRCRHHSSIDFTIRCAKVDRETVEAIAAEVKSVRYCDYSGDILSGGNTFTSVETTDDVKRELAEPFVFIASNAIANAKAGGVGKLAKIGDTEHLVEWDGNSFYARFGYKKHWLPSDEAAAAQSLAYQIATHKEEAA